MDVRFKHDGLEFAAPNQTGGYWDKLILVTTSKQITLSPYQDTDGHLECNIIWHGAVLGKHGHAEREDAGSVRCYAQLTEIKKN